MKLLLTTILLISTQTLSYQGKTSSVSELVFTNIAFYYGDKYVALRDLMDQECNTLQSVVLDTCKRANFDNYYYQTNIIKENISELQDKVKEAEVRGDFSNYGFPIALKNYTRDLSAVIDVLVDKTDFLSNLAHSMVDTGHNPLELQAGKSSLELSEKYKALLELWSEFVDLQNKENALLLDVQSSSDALLPMLN